jgi:hypothetical protein
LRLTPKKLWIAAMKSMATFVKVPSKLPTQLRIFFKLLPSYLCFRTVTCRNSFFVLLPFYTLK